MRKLLLLTLFFPLFAAAQKVYLIGDAGEPKYAPQNFKLISDKISDATEKDVLIFLGDNLYPKGLPDKEDPQRGEMEKKLIPQLEIMKAFPGQAYIIPGNHDWAQGRTYGWDRIRNMTTFIRDYFDGQDVFLPFGGCPGPIELKVNEQFTLILLDTQYFLHPWDKPDEESECENKSTIEALQDLESIIKRNTGKHIMIAAHHPVYTYGEHHGNFSLKEQLLPIPVLGSIQPAFRRVIGNIQDNTHPKYRAIMKQIVSSMDQAKHVIYASGHEHSLQLIEKGNHHFIVSGSGAKTTHVKMGKGSRFAKSEQGFAIVELNDSGNADVEFWGAESGLLHESNLYQKDLYEPVPPPQLDFSDSTTTAVASKKYEGKKGKNKWLGANYRDVWSLPVEVDVFDIGTEKGGLEILKKGGGMQTKSLRMEAADGRQYVLRSIEKYPENAIPPALRKTFAQDIVEDQISASHPYGAFIVPTLAEAAQIYHTNPKPVLIPDDPRFGQYRTTFAGSMALYEERANGEASRDAHFGGGEDIDGTLTVIENLIEDNDNSIDQNFVVRNRLFDMWIGDWDRHDDQWRWAQFDQDNGNMYRPIPRDRDQAFFINEGVIPTISARKWAIPKIEGFDERVDWAPGISQNARFFDRTFMNEPDWEDWLEQIRFLQQNLTDEVINDAISKWPEDVQELTGERIRKGLVARRADMERYAREHYLFLAKEVEVVGSDKHEYFLVEHLNENETKVTVRKRKKDGDLEQVIYERLFKANETKEIRLYGLDGEDVFMVKGITNPSIKVRIIGGTDKDLIINSAADERMKNLKVYDRIKSTQIQGNSKGILKLSDDPAINRYDRKAFKYDILMPLVILGANPDDGLFLGGGFLFTKNGWRKEPFAAKHSFTGMHALETKSYSFNYKSTFTDVLGKWDINPELVVQRPFFVNNFFGIGNETVFEMDRFVAPDDDPIDYYRVRMERIEADLNFIKNLGAYGNLTLGAGFRSVEVENTPNRVLSDLFTSDDMFENNNYLKTKIGVSVDTRSNKIMPQAGMTAFANVERFDALTDISGSFTRFSGEWAFYLSARLPSRLVIANRLGFAHNEGDTEFFNANMLGGRSNLRSYRRTRFYGETSMYHNVDLRLKLFSFRSYIFPGQLGILAFHDAGRVWVDGEDSTKWHTGTGFGIWVSPLNQLVLNINYGFGEDENIPAFYLGFFF